VAPGTATARGLRLLYELLQLTVSAGAAATWLHPRSSGCAAEMTPAADAEGGERFS